jgi:hypothetical protein
MKKVEKNKKVSCLNKPFIKIQKINDVNNKEKIFYLTVKNL